MSRVGGRTWPLGALIILVFLFLPLAALAETIRLASYNVALSRSGPGELLDELRKGGSSQIDAILEVIAAVDPDILLLNEIDFDADLLALDALRESLRQRGVTYDYRIALPPNTGQVSGVDLNGDGKIETPGDAIGFGYFPGQYGMAILSRYPVKREATRDFSHILWRDLAWAELPVQSDGSGFYSDTALEVLRLSSKGHWDVPVSLPGGQILHILASHPTPPVFDGPEDRNGLRNAAEIRFWTKYLDGDEFADARAITAPFNGTNFAVMGDLNADPADGDGSHIAIGELLELSVLQDPRPGSGGGRKASNQQNGANSAHQTDPALDTADWDDEAPGNLRVDYVLPSANLKVEGSGVYWPKAGEPGAVAASDASDHRLVWVDISF